MFTFENQKKYFISENIELTDFHSAGRAIGNDGKRNIYVDYGIPGELVDLEVGKRQRNGGFITGSIKNIIRKSSQRITPFCIHSGICGGCNWQHIRYEKQLDWKHHLLLKALKKYDILAPEIPQVIPSPKLQFFRNKLEYFFSNTNAGFTNHNTDEQSRVPILGFHPLSRSDAIVDISECYLQLPPSRAICDEIIKYVVKQKIPCYDFAKKSGILKSIVIRTSLIGEIMVIITFVRDDNKVIMEIMQFLVSNFPEITSLNYTILKNPVQSYSDNEIINFSGKQVLYERMDDLLFQVSPSTFFQPNPLQALNIYKIIREFAQLSNHEFVYDLYSGAGTITCYLAKDAAQIIGIEGSHDAVNDAIENVKLNKIKNVTFIKGDILETFNIEFIKKYHKPDLIILDPPRSGTLIEIKKAMLWAEPSEIIYVSCNPVSLAWDMKQLTEKYEISAIQPFDMFPHTHQLETVALLTLKKN